MSRLLGRLTQGLFVVLFMCVSFLYVPQTMAMQFLQDLLNRSNSNSSSNSTNSNTTTSNSTGTTTDNSTQEDTTTSSDTTTTTDNTTTTTGTDSTSSGDVAYSNRTITGYYYSPDSGKTIPKYDDLSPSDSEQYSQEN